MSACHYFLVSGRVQGVFYRASTVERARQLGLSGWVRNRDDGDVEVVACGDEADLKQLEAWLWQGPAHAKVDAVQVEIATMQDFSGFNVSR